MCDDPLAADIEWQPDPPERTEDTWITQDGHAVPIAEMTDDHLRNAIHYLDQRIQELRASKSRLAKEHLRRQRRRVFNKLRQWLIRTNG